MKFKYGKNFNVYILLILKVVYEKKKLFIFIDTVLYWNPKEPK